MWVTATEMGDKGLLPIEVYDANGLVISRKITGFDCETGEVESFMCDTDGRILIRDSEGVRRREKYPAPLVWKSISHDDLPRRKTELWDLQGR